MAHLQNNVSRRTYLSIIIYLSLIIFKYYEIVSKLYHYCRTYLFIKKIQNF